MAENRRSSGKMVTLMYCTALSNIPAGTPVACLTGNNVITTCGRTVTGFSATAGIGHHFIGILDEDVSAGQSPINVWIDGVFEMTASSAWTTAYVGDPVFPDSGKVCIQAAAAVSTGDAPIGTYIPFGTGERSGSTILVRINPMIWRHNTFGHQSSSASGIQGGAFPRNLG